MNFSRARRIGIGWSLLVLGLCGCAKGDDAPSAGRSPAEVAKVASGAEAKPLETFFPLKVGEKSLRVQVAVLEVEQQRGLMGRKDLGADDGMVFVYPAPRQLSFWMRNTPTPLDIGFFTADGVLGEVYPMYPYDETPVESRGADYTLALEVNQGWFAKHGLKPGAKLDLGLMADALRARGFRPERYSVRVE